MRILAGLDRPDDGTVEVCGESVDTFGIPRALRTRGVGLVQQHFTLVRARRMGEPRARPPRRTTPTRPTSGTGTTERGRRPVRARRWAARILAGHLSVGEQQRLELLRALDGDAQVLVLDEPTAVLTDAEADQLLDAAGRSPIRGRALAIITHRLAEVFSGSDRVSVLRAGEAVMTDAPVPTALVPSSPRR